MGGNLLTDLPADLSDEIVDRLVAGRSVRIERIVSAGHPSPPGFWYDQAEREFVVVLQGTGRIEFEDGEIAELVAGDWLEIPAHRRHRVAWTAPGEATVWLAVFF